MTPGEIDRIAAAVNALRPDWPRASLVTFIAAQLSARSRRDVAVALTWVACDSASVKPARVLEAGPWWVAVASTASATYRPPRNDETCPSHGDYAGTCSGCAADRIAGDVTPKRTERTTRASEYAEQIREQLWANRADHRTESEEAS